ncbi:MAG: hypothetical protein M1401_07230 [Chloroflexi bacterium]|nr:hypothetical protein [Chloroflexota bacterium]
MGGELSPRSGLIASVLVASFLLGACAAAGAAAVPSPTAPSPAAGANAAPPMTLEQAKEIAKAGVCAQTGPLTERSLYNDYTKTWWIDLDVKKEGCAPACVVWAETGQSEVNWRCTGLVLPQK